ncbi:MAG: DegV family protein [Chloroflexi bacterium]|nr:DegV family protein [Chloroflexota bacterium]MBP8057497.1 DegV family protein [Chloroflexota bacterium]
MRVVMDDTGDLPLDLAKKHHIHIIPINIHFGTEEYLSGVNISRAQFYEKTKTVGAHNFPKTSQPNPYQFREVYESILAEGEEEILTVVVSEKLSKTYESAAQAGKELANRGRFYLHDSLAGSAAQGFQALEAARMAEQGVPIKDILRRLEQMRQEQVIYLMIDNLEYAVKGGRVSSLQSVVASLLNIKPIMKLDDGHIVPASKVRTRKKALGELLDSVKAKVGSRKVKLGIVHANAPKEAEELLAQASQIFNTSDKMFMDLTLPVAINLGPGALGVIAIPDAQ